jgi:DNA adenine methylase
MRYMGGKSRLGKEISEILKSYRKPNQVYLEPFVGSGAVIEHMDGMRIGNDLFYGLLQEGWTPFNSLTKEEYDEYRYNTKWTNKNIHLQSFVGIGCSFGGKLWGGYAQGDSRNFCDETKRNLLKQLLKIQDVMFTCMDYKRLNPKNMLIYCDPPYKGTTQYKGLDDFNHEEFWNTVRKWSINNTVIVSEYQAPDDFEIIWSKKTKTVLTKDLNVKNSRVEKLFKLKNNYCL